MPFGKVVGATPNGRKAWSPLSDGSSASHGADVNGPTAILLSNFSTKNYGYRDRAARLLNIKFTPKCLEGDSGTRKLVSFIRTMRYHPDLPVLVRTPVIPGFNDSEEAITGILDLLAPYPRVDYQLLPYHRLGTQKYQFLHRDAPMPGA